MSLPLLEFSRLCLNDLEEILYLMRRTWPEIYGATGCPEFTSEMLKWLYGGPDFMSHLLYGCRRNGELVGFKSALFRPINWQGFRSSAHLLTHMTIAPELSFASRMALAEKLSVLQPLAGIEEDPSWRGSEIAIAYFDASKSLFRSARKAAMRMDLHQSSTKFRQAVLSPLKCESFSDGARGSIRPVERRDAEELLGLLRMMAGDDPSWVPSEESLYYHISNAPGAWGRIIEGGDSARGFMTGYRAETCRGRQITSMFAVEFLAYRDQQALALLLRSALDHAKENQLRGIILENTTCIPDADRNACGIMFTTREKHLIIRSKTVTCPEIQGFQMDIK